MPISPQDRLSEAVRQNVCALIDGYLRGSGRAESYASLKLYGEATFFPDFRAGKKSITVRKLNDLLEAFRDNWPPGEPWPKWTNLPAPIPPKKISGKRA